MKAIILRRLGQVEKAREAVLQALASDPLDFWARNELFFLNSQGGGEKARKEWLAAESKMGNVVQNYLEMAADYGRSGFWEEAAETLLRLTNSSWKDISTYPLLYYYLGYFLEKAGDGQKALRCYQKAGGLPSDYCFPFRLETLAVLRAALARNPQDARVHYYLGNLLFPLQPQAAIKEWEKARKIEPDFFLVHRNLGLGYAWIENDLPKAIKSMEKALRFDKNHPRLFYELDVLYEAGGVSLRKRLELLEKYESIVAQRDDSLAREILLLVQLGNYDKAIRLLESHHFHVWEGGGRIHDVFVDAHLLRGQEYLARREFDRALRDFQRALEYPENLEVGRPYHDRRAFQIYYFIGQAYEALGEAQLARKFYQRAVQEKQSNSEIGYYQGLALKRLGRKAEADKMFDDLIVFGRRLLERAGGVDFFAKFGEKQSETRRRAQAHYLLGLGYLGKGRKDEARAELERALKLNPNHYHARQQLRLLFQKD